jgi:MFS family permease
MSATALTLPAEQAVWRPKVNPWAIAATVSMAAFIEVLDTSVANVALPYIAGGLGASYDDSTWVLTSYLSELTVKMASEIMKYRFRPINSASHPLMGKTMAFAARMRALNQCSQGDGPHLGRRMETMSRSLAK